METIASRKNPLVLLMRRVAQGDADERGRVLLDGLHLVQEARAAGLAMSTAAFTTKVLSAPDGAARRLATTLAGLGCRVAQVSDRGDGGDEPGLDALGRGRPGRASAARAGGGAAAGREAIRSSAWPPAFRIPGMSAPSCASPKRAARQG